MRYTLTDGVRWSFRDVFTRVLKTIVAIVVGCVALLILDIFFNNADITINLFM